MIDYRQHPKVHDNGDGTWTVHPGYDGHTWTIRTTGTHQPWGEHFLGDRTDGNTDTPNFSGTFNHVAHNIIGSELPR